MKKPLFPVFVTKPTLHGLLPLLLCLSYALPATAVDAEREVLPAHKREAADTAVDRGLRFLLAHQQSDGSFDLQDPGQPGITGLCVLALLSRGHLPGQGEYGKAIDRAIDFILATQKADGLFSKREPERVLVGNGASHCAVYNHCIAGLVLSEVYGMRGEADNPRIGAALDKALVWIIERQNLNGTNYPQERGGWRYLRPYQDGDGSPPQEGDMSVTSWVMLFLRAAKNAGRDVPAKVMDDGLAFMARCFRPDGWFMYYPGYRRPSMALVGAGILAHSLAGHHDSPKAKTAAGYILRNAFRSYNADPGGRFHYATFYCTLAMFQIGGEAWAKYYPGMVQTVLSGQRRDGSWDSETGIDGVFGNIYTTSLCIMALNTPRQMIPIFQR